MGLSFGALRGADLRDALPDLAALRIAVFRDWPYLYDGDLAYEQSYLGAFADAGSAVAIAAYDGPRMIGAATGAMILDHADGFASAFGAQPPVPLAQMFYCAESVLLPDYRGQGLGHRFFDGREQVARDLGAKYSAFCAVQRPEDHPLRPETARDLAPFWRKRGYAPLSGVVAEFAWKDLGQTTETRKTLQFWGRSL